MDNRFLLVCEADDPDNWKLPGGRIEPMEEPELAAGRELMEELGVDAQTVGLQLVRQLVNDDGVHSRWIYQGHIDGPESLKPTSELSSYQLFSHDTVPDCPNRRHILDAYDTVMNDLAA